MHSEDEQKASFKEKAISTVKEIGSIIIRSFDEMNNDNVAILASGLVYSTLVAVVPCVAFLFAFLSLFGVLQPFINAASGVLQSVLGPELGLEIIGYLSTYASNAMGLGIVGLISFIITAIFLVNKVYLVLNQVFRTQPKSGMIRRFVTFFSFLVIGAIILTLMLYLQSSAVRVLESIEGDAPRQSMLSVMQPILTFMFAWLLLFALFYYVPNAKIRSKSAAIGSFVGVIALYISTMIFKFITTAFVSYSVIYGSMAAVFFVLLFMYVDWYIILVACEFTYVYQFKPERSHISGENESPAKQLSDSVNMLMLIGDNYRSGHGAISHKAISRKMALPPRILSSYLGLFQKAGLILYVANKNTTSYVPALPLDQIMMRDVVDAVFGYNDNVVVDTAGEAVAEEVHNLAVSAFKELTLENLLERI